MRNPAAPMLLVFVMLPLSVVAQTQPTTADNQVSRELKLLREQMDTGFGPRWDSRSFEALLGQLGELAPGDDQRIEAIDIAIRYARAEDLAASAKTTQEYGRDRLRLYVSWSILQSLHVVRTGMSAEAVVAVLGRPSQKWVAEGHETWRWYYESPMHVNPGLDVRFEKGVVVSVKGVSV